MRRWSWNGNIGFVWKLLAELCLLRVDGSSMWSKNVVVKCARTGHTPVMVPYISWLVSIPCAALYSRTRACGVAEQAWNVGEVIRDSTRCEGTFPATLVDNLPIGRTQQLWHRCADGCMHPLRAVEVARTVCLQFCRAPQWGFLTKAVRYTTVQHGRRWNVLFNVFIFSISSTMIVFTVTDGASLLVRAREQLSNGCSSG